MPVSPLTTRHSVVLLPVSVGAEGVAPSRAVHPEKLLFVRFMLLYHIWLLFAPRTTICSTLFWSFAVGLSIVVPVGNDVHPLQV